MRAFCCPCKSNNLDGRGKQKLRVQEPVIMCHRLKRGQLMRLTATQAVPAFDMGQGADAQGEYWLIHWPSTLGCCPLKGDVFAVQAGDALIMYDTQQAPVIAFQGFDEQTFAMMKDARLFLSERFGETSLHRLVEWHKPTDGLEVDTAAMA